VRESQVSEVTRCVSGCGGLLPHSWIAQLRWGSKAGDAVGKLPRLPGDFPLRFPRLVITAGEVMKPSRVPGETTLYRFKSCRKSVICCFGERIRRLGGIR
jgi:hypothetical protein